MQRLNYEARLPKSRKMVLDALKIYQNGEVCKMPTKEVRLGQTHNNLNRNQVFDAAVVLRLALYLNSGNDGGRDIYALLEFYLLNNDFTRRANELLDEFGRLPLGELQDEPPKKERGKLKS